MTQDKRNGKALSTASISESVGIITKQVSSIFAVVKFNVVKFWDELPRPHRIALLTVVGFVTFLMILPETKDEESQPARVMLDLSLPPEPLITSDATPDPETVTLSNRTSQIRPLANNEVEIATPLNSASQTGVDEWFVYQVRQGDTLANIFRAQNLPLLDLYAISAIEGDDKPLSQIKSGQVLRLRRNIDGKLDVVQIEAAGKPTVVFFRSSDGQFRRR